MKTKQVSFHITPKETMLIQRIAGRALKMLKGQPMRSYTRRAEKLQDIEMDLTACHANGCKLDLQKLLDFPDFDFAHDVFEIRKHIDRQTGKMPGWFAPRCKAR